MNIVHESTYSFNQCFYQIQIFRTITIVNTKYCFKNKLSTSSFFYRNLLNEGKIFVWWKLLFSSFFHPQRCNLWLFRGSVITGYKLSLKVSEHAKFMQWSIIHEVCYGIRFLIWKLAVLQTSCFALFRSLGIKFRIKIMDWKLTQNSKNQNDETFKNQNYCRINNFIWFWANRVFRTSSIQKFWKFAIFSSK